MAGSSSSLPQNSYHIRSTSMPSRSHPLSLTVDGEINKLKTWVASSSSRSSLTAEMICHGLGGLKCLYDGVENFLQLPLSQQALPNDQNQKWVEEVLDGSVRLLDICGTTRDIVLQMTENVKDLRPALRRRGGDLCLESKVSGYICSRKKMVKDIRKCTGALKRTDDKFAPTYLLDQDQQLSVVVKMLRDVMSITVSVFQAIFSFMSASRPKTKASKWLLVSRMMHKGQVACAEEDSRDVNEVESADLVLFTLFGRISSKHVEAEMVQQKAQKRLEALETGIGNLETGLEHMFRCMIQTRVSLLNILTN